MNRFLLSLAYRVFRNPFGAWALLAITIVTGTTAVLKLLIGALFPAALGPDALRAAFQLAFFAFIPLALFFGLAEYRWKDLEGERHRVFFWPLRKAVFAMILWLLLLAAAFGFNLLVFPRYR